ncbi:MAG: helix-turn-helix transcriptional regulator [Oscillospiraceae bacterium]|nr:helix-turn-helix transcriptional regulator [Oscillospiraceae bacterium]
MEYYEKLKATREDQNKTQQEVADALKTTRQQIGKYETGSQIMTIGRLKELCQFYNVSADYILGLPKGLDWPRE